MRTENKTVGTSIKSAEDYRTENLISQLPSTTALTGAEGSILTPQIFSDTFGSLHIKNGPRRPVCTGQHTFLLFHGCDSLTIEQKPR